MKYVGVFLVVMAAIIFTQMGVAAGGMSIVGTYPGVFNESSITKFYDADDSVVCYVLHPNMANMSRQSNFSGDYNSFEGNNAGSISCVKK